MSSATVIEVELLSGRYHAHVWGESQFGMAGPEWPPSPWRLLRALASAWFSAQPHPSAQADRDDLFEALGRADPPELWLPKASFHEIRYYQPLRLGGSDRVPHHDFYAVPEGGRFWFCFNVDLNRTQRDLLDALLGRIRYFGRSESRARLRLIDQAELPGGVHRVAPRDRLQPVTNASYRRVLCTAPDFRASDLWAVRDGAKTGTGAGYPSHLVDVLLDKKMPLPNGARWVEYAVPGAILVHEIRPRAEPPDPKPDVDVAEIRFRLSRRVPIPLQSLVAVARAFRDAAVERHQRITRGAHSLTLSGRQANGSVDRGHRHAYYLPRLSETRLTVETLVVRIPTRRLTRSELDALLGVGHIRLDGSPYLITVIPESTLAMPVQPAAATCWRSVTPFIPPLRHRSHRDRTSIEEQVAVSAQRLCGQRPASVRKRPGPGALGEVSPLLAHEYFGGDHSLAARQWTLTRRLGFWLEIVFDGPVVLDTPLGADAHFGAGQFEAVET